MSANRLREITIMKKMAAYVHFGRMHCGCQTKTTEKRCQENHLTTRDFNKTKKITSTLMLVPQQTF